jgi:cytoplasmic iron level regulating protein YaaA (DUF328/UPF0246 family)
MVFVLISPAKTMALTHARPNLVSTVPRFQKQAIKICDVLKKKSSEELQDLLGISQKLADLNRTRFHDFSAKPTKEQQDKAILVYQGDTYIGFSAKTADDETLQRAQDLVGILSGFYGLIRPLDTIQTYRLEMVTPLNVDGKKNLYEFWDDRLTTAINTHVAENNLKAVIGCASQEYLAAIQLQNLNVPFIQCDFKEYKNGKLQIVGLLAKRARGMMARYVAENDIRDVAQVKKFNSAGYLFNKELSSKTHYVFTRGM